MTDIEVKQLARIELAAIALDDVTKYLNSPDDLGAYPKEALLPLGYKRCGSCGHALKFYLYNVNNNSKTKCTGNCKACQKATSIASYNRNKGKKNYKEYYATHKEYKKAYHDQYYAKNKEKMQEKQKQYNQTAKGRRVMKKAHAKRRALLIKNKGIIYKREWVIDRDKLGGEFPICYLCNEPIKFEREIQLDHVVPVVMSGEDCFTNIACTHKLCNLRKEKDARNLLVEQVELIIERAETYMEKHPELFA